ncbi:F-box protein SKIP14-like [Salvia splendens]|uniref:F-box protein SKIP14-like n=1 Tax=Salvia splendens TaxID=180675 RepID=UPI001C27045A|nr:F-box protein SKIP14-like [Salvia splendens]XP_042048655.1 F-box protein SKIP14-like [Salvia splendens]
MAFNFSCERDIFDCSSSEPVSMDIVDRLPSDPFGMDIETTFTAITGWLEDLKVDYGGFMSNGMSSQEGYHSSVGWNIIWNNSIHFESLPRTIQLNERLSAGMQDYIPNGFQFDHDLDAALTLSTYENIGFSNGGASCSHEMGSGREVEGASEFEGAPHEAFNYVLSYLGVKDLLSIERSCSYLSSVVRGDPLFWRTIHIDQPLNERITDDVLMQLAGRAQGKLESLSLVECPKITNDGLRRVLEENRRLTKLSVPGCTRISIDSIVNCIKAYNCNNEFGGIKQVRIGGLYGVSHEHFEELNSLMGSMDKKFETAHKPHFYHRGNFYLPHDDDRTIDIEMCLKCEKFRLVYDCPSEGCRAKDKSPEVCKACTLCIGRCAQCGRCINDTEFEETFCLELLCSDCFKQLPSYQDKLDEEDNFMELDVV